MTIQRFLIAAGIIAASITLTACGGGSNHDDSAPAVTTPPAAGGGASPAPTPSAPTVPACQVENSSTVIVPKMGECTHANPKVNGGQQLVYSCPTGNGVYSNGLKANTLILGDFTYQCGQ